MTRRCYVLQLASFVALLAVASGIELCNSGGTWCVHWETDSDTIYFNLSAATTGWASVGFSEAAGMPNTDVVMCWVDDSGVGHVSDRYSSGYVVPPEDVSQDVTLLDAFEEGGTTFCSMSRPLDTGDTDGDIVIPPGSSFAVWAFGPSDPPAGGDPPQHGSSTKGNLPVAWVPPITGTVCSISNNVCVDYEVDRAAMSIAFTVTAQTAGWAAFGITTGGMYPADPMLCWVDADGAHVFDGWNSAYAAPSRDAQQDLTGVTGSEVAGVTTCSFTRALDTGDAEDYVIHDGQLTVAFAMAADDPTGDADAPVLPGHASTGVETHTFFTGVLPPGGLPPPPPAPTAGVNDCPDGTCEAGEFCESEDKIFCFTFQIIDDECTFTITAKATGWAALGFTKEAGKMTPADVYVASDGRVMDGFNSAYASPPADAQQDAEDVSSSVADGTITATFKRKLDTGDDDDVPFAKGDVNIIWGIANTAPSGDSLVRHDQRGSGTVNLFEGGAQTGAEDNTRAIFITHGVFMAVSWIFLSLIATFIARFMKSLGHLWFLLHVGMQVTVCLLTYVGFGLAVAGVSKSHGEHFFGPSAGVHQMFGYFIFFGAIAQPIIGHLSNIWFDPNRSGIPVFPDKVHWWLGRSLHLFGIVNVFLGFVAYGAGVAIFILAGVVVFGIFCLFVFKQVTQGQVHHKEGDKDTQLA